MDIETTRLVCSKVTCKDHGETITKYFRCQMKKVKLEDAEWEPEQVCPGTLKAVFTKDTYGFEAGKNPHVCGFDSEWVYGEENDEDMQIALSEGEGCGRNEGSSCKLTGIQEAFFRSQHNNLVRKNMVLGDTIYVCNKATMEKNQEDVLVKYFRCNMIKMRTIGSQWEKAQKKTQLSQKTMQYNFCRGTLKVIFTSEDVKIESGSNKHSCGFADWWSAPDCNEGANNMARADQDNEEEEPISFSFGQALLEEEDWGHEVENQIPIESIQETTFDSEVDSPHSSPSLHETAFGTGCELPAESHYGVKMLYSIVQKRTGALGGGGSGGAIYGELTQQSMQKVIDLMVTHTGLGKTSCFIDIGCGLGKPNLHVAQYPGVNVSVGIEVEPLGYYLGLYNLKYVLQAAESDNRIGYNCFLIRGDICKSKSLNPFTHVYMFDIG